MSLRLRTPGAGFDMHGRAEINSYAQICPVTQMMCAGKEKIDMKRKAMAAVLMMSMVIGSSLTVCAAPEVMADGTVFDAEYYAQM